MDESKLDSYRNLGLNISYYRRKRGYTQEQLAEQLGVDRTTISKVELATSGVSLDILFAMSEFLEVPMDRFFEERD